MNVYLKDPNYIGYLDDVPQRRVYLKIELRKREFGTELSISGQAGDGSAGQIDMHIAPNDITPAKNLDSLKIVRLWQIWKRWHLNGMQAHCEHQLGFALACGVEPHVLWVTKNAATKPAWSAEGEYGKKLAHKAPTTCPVCHYDYGSKWLYTPLPEDVIEFLKTNFKVTEIQ